MRALLLIALSALAGPLTAQSPSEKSPNLPPPDFSKLHLRGVPITIVKASGVLAPRCSIPLRQMWISPAIEFSLRKHRITPDMVPSTPTAPVPAPPCK